MNRLKDKCCVCHEMNLAQELEDGTFNCVRMNCCGACYCKNNCLTNYEKIKEETGKNYDCPICGATFPKSNKESFDRAMVRAEEGQGWALERIASYYFEGYGVSQSDSKAFEFYSSAAAKGEINSQNSAGFMYEHGRGVEQSFEKAFHLYSQAAEQGLPLAQFNVAICFANGRGVEKSMENAVKWYTRAADNGHKNAQNNLALAYLSGDGVEQNYEKAVHYFTLAAEQDHKDSQFSLALCYADGKGVKQASTVKAVYWFRQCLKNNENEELCAKAKHFIDEILSVSSLVCGWCLKENETRLPSICGRCKTVYYCDRNCQANHWKAEGNSHKEECKEP